MRQELFLKNKINRQIKQNGSVYEFKRFGFDEYGQLSDEIQETFMINGLFHETIHHIQNGLAETDGARVIDVPKSYILCLFDEGDKLGIDDIVEINGKKYRVINKINVGNYNVAYDIFLEMIINDIET